MSPKDQTNLNRISTVDLVNTLRGRGLFVSPIPPTATGREFRAQIAQLRGRRYRFAVISCTQIGSKYQQMTHLHTFYARCRSRGITTVFHCGDVVDGSKVYKGQEYELFLHGADEQREYVVKHYPHYEGITTKMLLGNHDESFWKTDGYNIVAAICRDPRRPDLEYVGDYLAFANIDGIRIALMHGAGGAAYARSYRLQKIIEQFASNQKPHMLFLGHYHIQCHLPQYRNVEGFMMGCFQSQTPFLTRLGLQPCIGGLIVEMRVDDKGILSVTTEWVPFYVPIPHDF